MAIISFISTQLVKSYPEHTHTHTNVHIHCAQYSNVLSVASSERETTLFLKRWVINAEETPKQSRRKRERETEAKTPRSCLSNFFFLLLWFETDLHRVCSPSHRQWDITLLSGFRGSDANWMSITHCDWLWSAVGGSSAECRPSETSYRL